MRVEFHNLGQIAFDKFAVSIYNTRVDVGVNAFAYGYFAGAEESGAVLSV